MSFYLFYRNIFLSRYCVQKCLVCISPNSHSTLSQSLSLSLSLPLSSLLLYLFFTLHKRHTHMNWKGEVNILFRRKGNPFLSKIFIQAFATNFSIIILSFVRKIDLLVFADEWMLQNLLLLSSSSYSFYHKVNRLISFIKVQKQYFKNIKRYWTICAQGWRSQTTFEPSPKSIVVKQNVVQRIVGLW